MAIALRGTPTVFGSTAVGTTYNLSVPAARVDGDFMLWLSVGGTATVPAAPPTGWTAVPGGSGTTTNLHFALWYRYASSEPASYAAPTLTSAQYSAVMAVYSGVDATTPFDVSSPAVVVGTTTTTFNAITPVTAGAWVFGIGAIGYASSTTIPASNAVSSTNLTIDAQESNQSTANSIHSIAVIGRLAWVSGATTPLMTATGTTARTLGFTVALRPAATAVARTRRMGAWR